ncbi:MULTISPECIES: methionine/alanine import family NSS transporter small subunit [Nocardia]|uniref:Methionine/alanine import family NSS transporter small subunit n=2 Tax=Nocardia TaxID=1817 RepID=A0A846W4B0_9NOCA|nr:MULTISPECIES: methionine/alanine import family NSS transporter small subunit [Nocardia]NKX88082.1 methionine/alanine import family NSS transporter small subunit [Nocardia coubleae]TDP41945.1 putative methionine/alanine importer small subunit [Nocardia ignorata]
MSAGAITMLIISIVVVWGGLLASVIALRRFPEDTE